MISSHNPVMTSTEKVTLQWNIISYITTPKSCLTSENYFSCLARKQTENQQQNEFQRKQEIEFCSKLMETNDSPLFCIFVFQESPSGRNGVGGNGVSSIIQSNGHTVANIIPQMRFSWEISNVDSVFSNGVAVARFNDLTKEAMLQAIKDRDLRFLSVSLEFQIQNII